MITHLLSTNLQRILHQANVRLVEYVKMFTNVLLVPFKGHNVKSNLTSKKIVYSHLQFFIYYVLFVDYKC
jgi:hypothetical protein